MVKQKYWAVQCKTCGEKIAVAEANSDPKKAHWRVPDKKFKRLVCPYCGAEHDYDSNDLQLYEGQMGQRPL